MKEYWKGTKPLWKAFWLIWIAGSLIIPLALSLLIVAVAPFFQVSAFQVSFVVFLSLLLFNPYSLFCWVAVWRCSTNVQLQVWKYISKAVVLLHACFYISNIYYAINELPKNI